MFKRGCAAERVHDHVDRHACRRERAEKVHASAPSVERKPVAKEGSARRAFQAHQRQHCLLLGGPCLPAVSGAMQPTMYEVQVPDGTFPGQAFQASVGGTLMVSQPRHFTP